MTQALPASPRDLPQCLDGLIDVMTRLAVEYGVGVEYSDDAVLLGGDIGAYRAATNTVIIYRDAPIADQTVLLIEVWKLLAIGPEAVRWGRRAPNLHLVPLPRAATELQPLDPHR